MRVMENSTGEKLAEILVGIGVSEDVAELVIPCFSEEESEDGWKALFEKLPKINLAKSTDIQNATCRKLFSIPNIGKDVDFQRKIVNLFYQIGGATAKYVFGQNYYVNLASAKKLIEIGVPREQMLNISAEAVVFSTSSYKWDLIDNWINQTEVQTDEIPGLLENCSEDASNGKIFLLNVYFYLKEKEENYQPTEADLPLLAKFEDLVLKNMDTLCGVKLTHEEEALLEYLNKEHEEKTVPNLLVKYLRRGSLNHYLAKLLAGAAFLHCDLSYKLENFVRVAAAVEDKAILGGIYNAVPEQYFITHATELDTRFLISKKVYLGWCAENSIQTVLEYNAETSTEVFVKVLQDKVKAKALRVANYMLNILKSKKILTDSKLEEIIETMKKELKNDILNSLCERNKNFSVLIRGYMEGAEPLSALLEKKEELRKNSNYYYYGNLRNNEYYEAFGEDDFYCRLLVLFTVSTQQTYYGDLGKYVLKNNEYDKNLKELFKIYEKQGLPFYYFIEVYQSMIDSCYSNTTSSGIKEAMTQILKSCVESKREEMLEALRQLGPTGRIAVLTAFFEADRTNVTILLDQFGDTSKAVREVLVCLLKDESEYRPKVIEKLASKKAAERETAAQILCAYKEDAECRSALEQALAKEKSVKLITYLQKELGFSVEEETGDGKEQTTENYVKELLKGNRKRSLAWLYETPMPVVHNKKKEEVPEDYLQAILLSYSTMEPLGVNAKTRQLTKHLDENELEAYAAAVFEKWLEKGAEAKKKWVLYFTAVFGGADMVQRLKTQINEWPRNSRGAIAVEAVKALACNGGSAALMTVDAISRKFKFRQVKDAAKTALSIAAKELGISTEELADRIVPDLGFGEDLSRTFDYGSRKFQVFITPALELEIFDEKQKKLKSLPSPGAKDDPELSKRASQEFKDMKKLLKTTITSQQSRLELALSTERKWTAEAWEKLFVKNPVMHQFAISLIWGAYEDGVLQETFRYMEDGTFNTAQEEEYELPKQAVIGLVHPLELSEEVIETWKEQLSDYEITQPIVQMERKIYLVEPEEEEKTELERFGGFIINNLSLSGKLMGEGWYRGSVLDAGGYYTFYKEDLEQHIGAELEFSGAFVGGDDEDVTIYEIRFYRAGTVEHGSYIYDTIKPEHSYLLKDVPKRFFSETVYQLTKLLSGSSRKDPDWRAHKR